MKILNFLIEASLYALASIYFHISNSLGLLSQTRKFLMTQKVKLDIHTFIGAAFLVLFLMALMGKIAYFLPFHDGMSLSAQNLNGRGTGGITLLGFASTFLLLFSRGPFVFAGYFLLGITIVVMLSFADPKPIIKDTGTVGLYPVTSYPTHSKQG